MRSMCRVLLLLLLLKKFSVLFRWIIFCQRIFSLHSIGFRYVMCVCVLRIYSLFIRYSPVVIIIISFVMCVCNVHVHVAMKIYGSMQQSFKSTYSYGNIRVDVCIKVMMSFVSVLLCACEWEFGISVCVCLCRLFLTLSASVALW